MKRRGFGWLPDMPRHADGRQDWTFGDRLTRSPKGAPPRSHSNAHLVLDILDQQSLGACVPCAGFQAIRMAQVRQGNPNAKLGARLMGYYLARAAHGMAAHDAGTHLRTFFWALNRFGFCYEADYPYGYDIARFASSPSIGAYRYASDQKSPTRYWAVPYGSIRIDTIKRAVADGYGVCFGVHVDDRFADGRIDPAVAINPPRAGITYGHAMLVDGYLGDAFTVVNSWGEEFGDRGRCLFSAEYLMEAHSVWVVEQTVRSA